MNQVQSPSSALQHVASGLFKKKAHPAICSPSMKREFGLFGLKKWRFGGNLIQIPKGRV